VDQAATSTYAAAFFARSPFSAEEACERTSGRLSRFVSAHVKPAQARTNVE
jgi:hypothetical protein